MGTTNDGKKSKAKKRTLVAKASANAPVSNAAKFSIMVKKARTGDRESPAQHVTFDEQGEPLAPRPPPAQAQANANDKSKKRTRKSEPTKGKKNAKTEATTAGKDADGDAAAQNGGKSDRSPEAIQSARYYLEQWKARNEPVQDDQEPWKFKKVKQLWILRWMFEADVVPKSMFSLALEYLSGIQGAARQRVLQSAQEILDAGVPDKASEGDANETDVMARVARRRYKRALQIAELLS